MESERSEISLDIWDKKYRLKDKAGTNVDGTIEDTYARVARALADVEESNREEWQSKFLWALENGAIPAGRIMSNAGAGEHKPATSLINCVLAPEINDSMAGIMDVAKDAALTLRAGSGIGYEFSTLRPAGAYVAGAGASTSGPLPFMDIFDAMCKTVSSAGGRRGAQMATFDIRHPDIEEFIKAKRADGRLRFFNCSVLITDAFMSAVRADDEWKLIFPALHDEAASGQYEIVDDTWPGYVGTVPCRVYKTIPARKLFDLIMSSTYDYAEPGVLFIDEINRNNNLWFCENLRATNPCVTADSWVLTGEGPRQIIELIGKPFDSIVDGKAYRTTDDGAYFTGISSVLRIVLESGHSIQCTEYHKLYMIVNGESRLVTASELNVGDVLRLQNQSSFYGWGGIGSRQDGKVLAEKLVNNKQYKLSSRVETYSHEFYVGMASHFSDMLIYKHDRCYKINNDDRETLEILQRMYSRLGITSVIGDGSILINPSVGFSSKIISIENIGMHSVYCATVPGINVLDINGIYSGNCGEQSLPPNGACLLGSINLAKFVSNAFTKRAEFNWDRFTNVVRIFTRMLDNVVELNGLPLAEQRREITRKRRHGMGFTGLGSVLVLLGHRYGSEEANDFASKVMATMAIVGFDVGIELAIEKGPAPIFNEKFEVTSELLAKDYEIAGRMGEVGIVEGSIVSGRELFVLGNYIQRLGALSAIASNVGPNLRLIERLREHGCRFTHHTSIAPTGTISLAFADNVSNGIEPSFAHSYMRNVIRAGRKTKEQVEVRSFEYSEYCRLIDASAKVDALPEVFVTADELTPNEHLSVMYHVQPWCDSSISKTINVATGIKFDEFTKIYETAHRYLCKGCTTFRFNPEVFSGVLVKKDDLKATKYQFTLVNGDIIECSGDDDIEYDGEVHKAANLFDALKEGYYGRL